VTALTDNGAEISTLAMRGLVSLPPAVGWRRSQSGRWSLKTSCR